MYILIPATFVVWGLIIYRIIHGMNSENDTPVSYAISAVAKTEIVADTFSINPVYRDPFLGKRVERRTEPETPKPKAVVQPAVVQAIQWPAVVYGGMIKNQKLNKEMIMVQIDGQEYIMKKGETINGVTLKTAFKDSIEVNFSKEKKIIHK